MWSSTQWVKWLLSITLQYAILQVDLSSWHKYSYEFPLVENIKSSDIKCETNVVLKCTCLFFLLSTWLLSDLGWPSLHDLWRGQVQLPGRLRLHAGQRLPQLKPLPFMVQQRAEETLGQSVLPEGGGLWAEREHLHPHQGVPDQGQRHWHLQQSPVCRQWCADLQGSDIHGMNMTNLTVATSLTHWALDHIKMLSDTIILD